jgi:predicted Zn-dependent peptidase
MADPLPPPSPAPAALGPQVTRLSNGMRVATESVPFAGSATVGVWIDAGSRFETDATNGAAHFLEHMAFKGTARRSQHDLEVEIEDMGAQLNAYTSREQTCFFAKVLGADVARAVDILADQIQHSTLDPAAVERERSTILREMNEIEGMPEEMVFDHLHATAFQHSPLGRNILGPAENVKALTRDALADYVTTNYRADRMVLVGTGAVEHGELVKAAEAAFAKLPTGGPSAEDMVNAVSGAARPLLSRPAPALPCPALPCLGAELRARARGFTGSGNAAAGPNFSSIKRGSRCFRCARALLRCPLTPSPPLPSPPLPPRRPPRSSRAARSACATQTSPWCTWRWPSRAPPGRTPTRWPCR